MPPHSHHSFQLKTLLHYAWQWSSVVPLLPASPSTSALCSAATFRPHKPCCTLQEGAQRGYYPESLSCVSPSPSHLSTDSGCSELVWGQFHTPIKQAEPHQSVLHSQAGSQVPRKCPKNAKMSLSPPATPSPTKVDPAAAVPTRGTIGDSCLHLGTCQALFCFRKSFLTSVFLDSLPLKNFSSSCYAYWHLSMFHIMLTK